ncbi:hypothetical protein Taro_040880 [Colocasia esculenta]|uniref:Uncharacterized protein n=1 Tax=Colocasia esculenta TaxID=4460 RepID=A0A843WN61_COLES|nr:hypothetical protein [Colocasia esculenta]
MRGECLELKKKLKKEKFTFKKAKVILATWSDEDEDENSQATSGDDEVQCLMARSDDSTEGRYYARHVPKQGSKDQEKQEKIGTCRQPERPLSTDINRPESHTSGQECLSTAPVSPIDSL